MDKLSKTERLIAICNRFFGGCKRKMALCLGITEQSLSKWFLRGRIDYDLVIEKIPSLNPVWLLLGVGPMILTQENSANENINENNDSDMVRITLSEYVELKETIKIQDEKIKAIQSIVA